MTEDADAPPARLADISDVVCPPYDVINDAQREALLSDLGPRLDELAVAVDLLRSELLG